MSEFILNEAEVSGDEGSDGEIMDVEDDLVDLKIDDESIDDNFVDEDLHFYHRKGIIGFFQMMMNTKRRRKRFTKFQIRKMLLKTLKAMS